MFSSKSKSTSSPSKAPVQNEAAILECFEKYRGELSLQNYVIVNAMTSTNQSCFTDPEIQNPVISMDGIIEICEELELDPASDVRVLVMVWRLQSDSKAKRNPSEVSQEDFVAGMDKMR